MLPAHEMKVGLMVFLANSRDQDAPRSYKSIRAIAQQAEADGFDSIWLPDHLLYRAPGRPTRGVWECWTMLAALAEATERIEIGPLVLSNSMRNPALLARMATALDEVSGGRLILGVGTGWNEPEYTGLGLPFDHRVDRFEEALQVLVPLPREGYVDFAGHYYSSQNFEDVPRGPRPAGPPLLIGGEGPRMLRLTARHGDMWNIGYMGGPETMAGPFERIDAACRDVGRERATLGVTALIGLWFPDLQPAKPTFFEEPLTGTPDELAEAMRGYAELGVEHVMFQCEPYADESIRRLTQALNLYRAA
jgi:alkanesulfonate monooxygenase SsuD/methylene tetrahydromethanopterin reductase-like flavin-dependent oxidoreductase (luciferase family)